MSDENLCEVVNNNEMEIYTIPLSKPFMLLTEKIYDNELNDNASLNYRVEKTLTSLNKNVNNNIEIDSKAVSNIHDSISKNEYSNDDDVVIDVVDVDNELNENTNNNKVENNELLKDKSQKTLKDKVNENNMVVDREGDNINDNSSIFRPKGEFLDIYANDNDTNIVSMSNLIYGRFPTDFQPIIRLKPNEKVYDNILFLITTPSIHRPENDQNTPISIVKGDIEKFDQNLFLGDHDVNSFLRWMSL